MRVLAPRRLRAGRRRDRPVRSRRAMSERAELGYTKGRAWPGTPALRGARTDPHGPADHRAGLSARRRRHLHAFRAGMMPGSSARRSKGARPRLSATVQSSSLPTACFDILHPVTSATSPLPAPKATPHRRRQLRSVGSCRTKGRPGPITPEGRTGRDDRRPVVVDGGVVFDEDTPYESSPPCFRMCSSKAPTGLRAIVGRDVVEAHGGQVVRAQVEKAIRPRSPLTSARRFACSAFGPVHAAHPKPNDGSNSAKAASVLQPTVVHPFASRCPRQRRLTLRTLSHDAAAARSLGTPADNVAGLTPPAQALFVAARAHAAPERWSSRRGRRRRGGRGRLGRPLLPARARGTVDAAADRAVLPLPSHEVDPYRGLAPHFEVDVRARARAPRAVDGTAAWSSRPQRRSCPGSPPRNGWRRLDRCCGRAWKSRRRSRGPLAHAGFTHVRTPSTSTASSACAAASSTFFLPRIPSRSARVHRRHDRVAPPLRSVHAAVDRSRSISSRRPDARTLARRGDR